jgi:hypothetical protein
MRRVPRRFSHFVFGVIQSGLTCAIASAIASYPFLQEGSFVAHWMRSWAVIVGNSIRLASDVESGEALG